MTSRNCCPSLTGSARSRADAVGLASDLTGVIADRGYDHDKYRRELWRRGVKPRLARRRTEHGSGLGRVRWVVERTFAWLHNFRRLRIRWERDAAALRVVSLGCSLICWRHIRP